MRKFIDTVPITKADCNVQFTVISVSILVFFSGFGLLQRLQYFVPLHVSLRHVPDGLLTIPSKTIRLSTTAGESGTFQK